MAYTSPTTDALTSPNAGWFLAPNGKIYQDMGYEKPAADALRVAENNNIVHSVKGQGKEGEKRKNP